jgi:hypothetical protein
MIWKTEGNPEELAPLDEHGNPKYKGKKRGRKPKAKKRKMNQNREKRKPTGYTVFMAENHPAVRAANPSLTSPEVIAEVAKQWKNLNDEQQQAWKERANGSSHVGDEDDAGNNTERIQDETANDEEQEQQNEDSGGEFEDEDVDGDEEHSDIPPATKKYRRQKK